MLAKVNIRWLANGSRNCRLQSHLSLSAGCRVSVGVTKDCFRSKLTRSWREPEFEGRICDQLTSVWKTKCFIPKQIPSCCRRSRLSTGGRVAQRLTSVRRGRDVCVSSNAPCSPPRRRSSGGALPPRFWLVFKGFQTIDGVIPAGRGHGG